MEYLCQQLSLKCLHLKAGRALGSAGVAERPVFHREFGLYMQALRVKAGFQSQRGVVMKAERLGLASISRLKLRQLEEGRTLSPDPKFLRELATLYRQEYQELVKRFIDETTVRSRLLYHYTDLRHEAVPSAFAVTIDEIATAWRSLPSEDRARLERVARAWRNISERDQMTLVELADRFAGVVADAPEVRPGSR